jgi:phage gpG-like protein
MKFELNIDTSSIEGQVNELFEKARGPMQAAMANRYASIVHNNFGTSGEDRPFPWPSLGGAYAFKYHGGDRTPRLILTGELQASIQIYEGNDYAAVWTDNDHADLMQWGSEADDRFNVPARPFFPLYENGTLTPYAESECIMAAQNALNRVFVN